MKKRIHYLILPGMALLAGLCACSVKESRWPCPCYLSFTAEGSSASRPDGGFLLSVYKEGDGIPELRRSLSWDEALDGSCEIGVSKGEKAVSVLEGAAPERIAQESYLIAPGCQCDSVRAFACRVSCTSEEALVHIVRNKQFATVFLKMENGGQSAYPYDLTVSGRYDGFSLLSLEPHEGAFRHECIPFGAENEFRFRLPRQGDGSLLLELREKGAGKDSEPLESIRLGEYIRESGYDWQAESLPDIYLGVDYARAEIRINVNDWETVVRIKEEI